MLTLLWFSITIGNALRSSKSSLQMRNQSCNICKSASYCEFDGANQQRQASCHVWGEAPNTLVILQFLNRWYSLHLNLDAGFIVPMPSVWCGIFQCFIIWSTPFRNRFLKHIKKCGVVRRPYQGSAPHQWKNGWCLRWCSHLICTGICIKPLEWQCQP